MAHDNAPQSTEVRAASAPATEAVADAQGRVSIDLPCRTCGYVLRGLSVEGNCPECGLAIRQSMRRGRLEDSDPDWLRRLAMGCRVFNIGFGASLATLFIGILVSFGLSFYLGSAGASPAVMTGWQMRIQILITIGMSAAAVIVLVGAWMLTERDPASTEPESTFSIRLLARYGLLVGVLVTPLGMFMSQFMGSGKQSMTVAVLLGAGGIIATIVGAVAWFSYFRFLRQLLNRIPQPKLARQAGLLAWCFAGVQTFLSLSGVAVILLMPATTAATAGAGEGATQAQFGGASIGMMVAGLNACAATGLYAIVSMWTLIVHILAGRRLSALARQAATA